MISKRIAFRAPTVAALPIASAVSFATLGSATIGFLGPQQPTATLAMLLLSGALACSMLMPVSWLPSLALLTVLILPTESLPLPAVLRSVPVGLLFLVVWQLRTRPQATPLRRTIVAVGAFATWLAMSFVFAGMLSPRSVTWSITALAALGLFALRPPPAIECRLALNIFTAVASVIAVFAVVESFVIGFNPVLGTLFAATTEWGNDTHTGIPRATTSIGHPLMNGTVFAVAAVLVAGRLFDGSRRSPGLEYGQLAVLIAGIAASQTRTGAIGALAGLFLLVGFSDSRGQHLRRAGFFGLTVLLVVFFALALSQRNNAGLDFTINHRASVPSAALASIDGYEIFGVGPAMSDQWRASMRLPGSSVTLENGYAQLLVSLGPVGMLLFIANLLLAIRVGLSRGPSRTAAAGLATLALAFAGFNAIESAPRLFVLLAVLIAAIYAHNPPNAPTSSPTRRESTA